MLYLGNQRKKVSYCKKRQQCQALLGMRLSLETSKPHRRDRKNKWKGKRQDASRRVWRKKSEIRNWGHRVEGTLKRGLPGCVSSTPGGRADRGGSERKGMFCLCMQDSTTIPSAKSAQTLERWGKVCAHTVQGLGPRAKRISSPNR